MSKKKAVSKKSLTPKVVGRTLVIPDCHIPYHDHKAFSLMVKVAKASKITEIVILGDFGEYFFASGHGATPGVPVNAQWEIDEVNKALDFLDVTFPKAKKVYIEGNHEYRLQRYLATEAGKLEGLNALTTQKLLNLRERGWKWVPYGPSQLYQISGSHLYARHCPYANGVHVAHSSVVKAGCSIIFGHVHRIQESQVVMANGTNHRGITPGWLGNKDHKVFNYVANHHQWALGFDIVDIMSDGMFFNHIVHIIDYVCSFDGKVWV